MRVVHVIGSIAARFGGPSKALKGLALAQLRGGQDVRIITDDAQEPVGTSAAADTGDVQVTNLPAAGRLAQWGLGACNRLGDALRGADILHLHGVWEPVICEAAAAGMAAGVPFVVRPCGMLDAWALRRKRFKKWVYLTVRLRRVLAKAAAIHCMTDMEASSTRASGVPVEKMIIEPNGLAMEEFAELPKRGEFRESHGIGTRPMVTFLGRIHPGKGVEYLLRALPHVATPDLVVVIVGPTDSAFAGAMMEEAKALASRARIVFTGMLQGPARIAPLVDADVFALPSEHENFGVAIAEALASGCPVVVSNHVGIASDIQAHGLGSVTSLEPSDIAAAIDDWLGRRLSIERPFQAARSFALERYDWNDIARRWLGHYEQLVA
jgi:glycosyltransferase involved in cell wall biosynthesis